MYQHCVWYIQHTPSVSCTVYKMCSMPGASFKCELLNIQLNWIIEYVFTVSPFSRVNIISVLYCSSWQSPSLQFCLMNVYVIYTSYLSAGQHAHEQCKQSFTNWMWWCKFNKIRCSVLFKVTLWQQLASSNDKWLRFVHVMVCEALPDTVHL